MRHLMVVASVLALLLAVAVAPASASYNGSGDATYYPADDALGACSYGRIGEVRIAALNQVDYGNGRMCGAYVEVKGPRGKVVVKIMDRCPECKRGDIDLNRAVYGQVADPLAGRVKVSWRLVSPNTSAKLSFRYKEGSNQHWCALRVRDHRNPVVKLEIRNGKTWRSLPRTDYNYFIVNDGKGCGGDIRVTDVGGQQLVEPSIAFRPGVVQKGTKQFTN
ncbi:hypothetical protein BBK82_37935 [Lentzea guizhouensis]|uniref:RlpA-like protein double-psi beta-barrel domain-containing protein n=1 Tax=Lentzea guizhouensis TaxID=1586287 RepID=A0A1B2HT40_9PSEU|nr:expansin EXLX1 family cellulose-binding protein [Lentzea guizhouensis]ANZ40910.1 hypothetical protein BBK82_37935 [Lentzea guizhouensis]